MIDRRDRYKKKITDVWQKKIYAFCRVCLCTKEKKNIIFTHM